MAITEVKFSDIHGAPQPVLGLHVSLSGDLFAKSSQIYREALKLRQDCVACSQSVFVREEGNKRGKVTVSQE